MTLLESLVAAQVALIPVIPRVVPDVLFYGTDLACVLDVTPTLDEVDPQSTVAIGEALVRRLITPRGRVLDDGTYGFDLRGQLNHGVTQPGLTRLQSSIRVECLKDDRIDDATVSVVMASVASRQMRVQISATAADSAQDFSLTFFVTSDGVQLIESIDQHG
jgi:hypothetical protein